MLRWLIKRRSPTQQWPLAYYLSQSTAQSSHYNPAYFLDLITLFRETENYQRVSSVKELKGSPWLYPIFLNNPYRVSRSLAAKKGGRKVYFDAIDDQERRAIVSKRGFVTLDLLSECIFPREDMFIGIHDGLKESGIPANQLSIVNGNMLSERLYNNYCDKWGTRLENRVRMVPFHGCLWLLVAHNQRRHDDPGLSAILEECKGALNERKRGKAFVSFNGRVRPHRLHILLYLASRGLLDKGYVSFLAYSSDGPMPVEDLQRANEGMPFSDETSKHIAAFARNLPLTLDVQVTDYAVSKRKIKVEMPWSSPEPRYYLDSYFSVVIDTIMLNPTVLFLTPIIYKSMMNCHPFVYFGGKGALAELRRLNFQTFDPFIDERYDTVDDPNERMRYALKEVERLANMPIAELHSLYCNLWPRLEHNFRRFWYDLPSEFSSCWRKEVIERVIA